MNLEPGTIAALIGWGTLVAVDLVSFPQALLARPASGGCRRRVDPRRSGARAPRRAGTGAVRAGCASGRRFPVSRLRARGGRRGGPRLRWNVDRYPRARGAVRPHAGGYWRLELAGATPVQRPDDPALLGETRSRRSRRDGRGAVSRPRRRSGAERGAHGSRVGIGAPAAPVAPGSRAIRVGERGGYRRRGRGGNWRAPFAMPAAEPDFGGWPLVRAWDCSWWCCSDQRLSTGLAAAPRCSGGLDLRADDRRRSRATPPSRCSKISSRPIPCATRRRRSVRRSTSTRIPTSPGSR